MDTGFHTVLGAEIGYVFAGVPGAVVGGILGAVPDVIGWTGLRKYKTWERYLRAHKPTWWKWILFPWGLHIFIDSLTHKEGKEWWVKWWIEIIGWIFLCTVVLFMVPH